MRRIVAITGLIGSGKSVVSEILRVMGYDVYDCDSRAKTLMDRSSEIKERLREEIDREVVTDDGQINRQRLAEIVFSDARKLASLNNIVHQKVREDLKNWIEYHPANSTAFFETAILEGSELQNYCCEVWLVDAPTEIRIKRLEKRGKGMSREEAVARASTQRRPQFADITIENDGLSPILPQILKALYSKSPYSNYSGL